MTSTSKDLIRDFKIGRAGEDIVQKFFLEKEGVITRNVGEERLGWDLQIERVDAEQLGINEVTFSEEKFLKRFTKRYGKTFECKRDKTSDRTGNFFWEVWSNYRVKNAGCMFDCKADTLVIVRGAELLFFDRPKLSSWVFDEIFLQTELYDTWQKKTLRTNKNKLMCAKNNIDVRGILLPIKDMKTSPACLFIYDRVKKTLTERNTRKR